MSWFESLPIGLVRVGRRGGSVSCFPNPWAFFVGSQRVKREEVSSQAIDVRLLAEFLLRLTIPRVSTIPRIVPTIPGNLKFKRLLACAARRPDVCLVSRVCHDRYSKFPFGEDPAACKTSKVAVLLNINKSWYVCTMLYAACTPSALPM